MNSHRGSSFASILVPALFAFALILVSPAYGRDDCDDYYFGISRAPDYPKALKCYQENKAWDFVILMHLNGEGVTADVQKADELFRAWQKESPEETKSLQAEALQEAIRERKAKPGGSFKRLDYCSDIAGDTVTLNSCRSIEEKIAEAGLTKVIAGLKTKLGAGDAAILDKVAGAFAAFREADGMRMYQQYIDGTIRNIAAAGQASFVREQFLKLLAETVERPGLKPASENDYKAADKELNEVYREGIRTYTQTQEDLIKQETVKGNRETYKQNIQAYKDVSKKAQLRWIKYRDLCAELARSLYKDKAKTFDPALSMNTAVTKMRVIELRNDPAM
ncbi:MAG: lysozyme inhibitor LprI family protein [Syntrophobacteraceae bacterium]